MHYLVYKTTNNSNNKTYIGQHQTDNIDDGYLGSGTTLQRAITKYGKDAFSREIIKDCETFEEMDSLEAELVDEEFILRKDTYNLALGGNGGNGTYIRTPATLDKLRQSLLSYVGVKHSPEGIERIRQANLGKTLSPETREKVRQARLGTKQSPETVAKRQATIKHNKIKKELHKIAVSMFNTHVVRGLKLCPNV